jgi:asparagine synthase (glutamine-hydrolysing)
MVAWFVVLPDTDAGATVAAALADHATQQLDHPSGRPWLVGRWHEPEFACAQTGNVAVAVLGQHVLSGTSSLETVVGRVRSVDDLDRVSAALAGSFHLIASVQGVVRAQGTVLGQRRLFGAHCEGVDIAADRSDVLGALVGIGIDVPRLAVHLLFPPTLHPVTDHPIWRGVGAVAPDHCLLLDCAGRARTLRRWTAPDAALPMADAALALRDTLGIAVDARLESGAAATCDLAGLDSTAVCSLAARQGAPLTAFTAASPDPRDDDLAWARRSIAALPSVRHEVVPADRLPLFYEDLLNLDDVFDEPCPTEPDRPRFASMMQRIVHSGSAVHLNGFGGDELLHGAFAHLHRMVRVRPLSAVSRIRGFRVKQRWPVREVVRQLVDRRPYADWLAGAAETLTGATPARNSPMLDWGGSPRFAPWISPAAVEMVRGLIRAEVADAQPLAADRGRHFDLEALRAGARGARQYDQIARRIGVPTASPFYDDQVVEVGLAVRPHERLTPWRYKPLIVDAMRGVVPEASLRRETKSEWSVAHQQGRRKHADQLVALAEDSRLAQLGLIDLDQLRAFCTRPVPRGYHPGVFDTTAGCEKWLRSLEPSGSRA